MNRPVLGSKNMPCALPKRGTFGVEGVLLVGGVSAAGVWLVGLVSWLRFEDVGNGV